MSAAAPIRTKLKQARLGEVQRHVLAVLAVQKAEADLNGMAAGGLTYRDVMAEIHQYVVIGERQWLPSVVARLEIEDGRQAAAAAFLLQHISDAIDVAYPVAIRLLDSARRPDANDWMAVEGAYFADRAVTRLDQLRARVRPTLTQFQQFEVEIQQSVADVYLLNAWEWAKELALTTTRSYEAAQLIHALPLPDEMKEKASGRLAVQHASLSRSLRVLEAHLLIERRDVQIILDDGTHAQRETRFFLTDAGLARLRPE